MNIGAGSNIGAAAAKSSLMDTRNIILIKLLLRIAGMQKCHY
jgi:hypothetical protein